ncbi:hypothetical protein J3P71_06695 [Rhizobium leguminosarum]|uniref:hypothetical protein n=1 Tax=Rhizobium leguminosarum TaxID=384 RepID=UPI001441BFB3|nr:hypothetical protein [Rhizobium leguminosarum]MBY5839777.1 hypothetical protein [Rhizobium leguminosarum]NKM79414.1 hypothetical protein [Rhizobium leguminosarum bv. viciae]QSZ09448.1 hypothetical protein J3P71_06695 [Rhizobium leguminosarum]
MDVEYFLKERTKFIRYFYDNGVVGFREILRQIDEQEEPFVPLYSEDGEPPFVAEYMDATYGIGAVGVAALSMLSDTLKVFFMTWEKLLGIEFPADWRKRFKKEGFVAVYRDAFGQIAKDDWATCPVDFDVIEQVVLARNDAQHGKHLHEFQPSHSTKTIEKYSPPLFVTEYEKGAAKEEIRGFAGVDITISREDLWTAIEQVEMLADWMELRLQAVRFPHGAEAQKLAAIRAASEPG